jgi:hypothetical protein
MLWFRLACDAGRMTVAVADVEDRMLENGGRAVMRLEACVRVMAIETAPDAPNCLHSRGDRSLRARRGA